MAKHKPSKRPRRQPRKARARPRQARILAPDARAVEAALAGIVHDIRTPLTGIVALAELLATSDIGAREREWATAIKSGADHLAALTTLIVDAVKADAAGLVPCSTSRSRRAASPRRSAMRSARARAIKASRPKSRSRPICRRWWPATRCACARRWKTSPTMRSSSPAKAPSSSPPAVSRPGASA